jgi:hypothetical protein
MCALRRTWLVLYASGAGFAFGGHGQSSASSSSRSSAMLNPAASSRCRAVSGGGGGGGSIASISAISSGVRSMISSSPVSQLI